MTVSQRIGSLRKELNMSQEAFGDALGVSRQAISKWESGQSLPDVDKLSAMAKLCGVSVDWILGIDDARTEPREAPEMAQPAAPTPAPDVKTRRWRAAAILVMAALLIWCVTVTRQLGSMKTQQQSLQQQLGNLQSSFGDELYGVTNRVEEILKAQNNLLAQYELTVGKPDLAAGTVEILASLTPRTYTPGMGVELIADCQGESLTFPALEGEGHQFTAALILPLCDSISVSAALSAEGAVQTQLLEVYGYLLSETFLYTGFDNLSFWLEKPMEMMNNYRGGMNATIGFCYDFTPEAAAGSEIVQAEFQLWLNGEKIQAVDGRWIEGKGSGEGAVSYPGETLGDYGFAAILDLGFMADVAEGDKLEVCAIGTDNFGRRYCVNYNGYVLGDGRFEFTNEGRDPYFGVE